MNDKRWRIFLARFWGLAGAVSVRTKIFGIVLGSTLLLSLGFAVQVRLTLHELLEQKSRQEGISIAREVAARSTDLILVNDLFALHQLLVETQTNFSDVRYAFVMDAAGVVLAHTFGSGFPMDLIAANSVGGEAFQNTIELETDEGLVWDVAVPIFGGQSGTARVGISDLSLRQTLGSLTTQLSLTIFIVLASSLLAATFLTWILTRPILGLVEATRAVGKGDFSVQVERWANDEIGDLAEAFNHMTTELARTDELRQERELLRKQLLEGVITAQEDERRRIARELHDSTSQSLTSLKVGLRALETTCECPQTPPRFENLRQVLDQTLDDVHSLAVQLRPALLDDLGLAAALERFLQEWQSRHKIMADTAIHLKGQRLPESVETALYRIVQEALTNVARHAGAHTVSVLVERHRDELITVIEDDGVGFDEIETQRGPHLGLLGIRERAELLGGSLAVESEPGQGASLFIRIPLEDPWKREVKP